MKLRQCVFVCKDLESSREELCDVLGIEKPIVYGHSFGGFVAQGRDPEAAERIFDDACALEAAGAEAGLEGA